MNQQMMSQDVVKSTNFSGVARIIGLILLAFVCALVVHLINHKFLLSENPTALRDGVSVATADDASYIRPALNFLSTGEWRGSSPGVAAYVVRSPGYGMVFGLFAYLFGETGGLRVLVLFQLTLWSLAVGAIPFLARSLGLNEKISWLLGVFISLMPMFYGFLSYTLTEALTPSLVIFFYTFLFRGVKGHSQFLLLSAIMLGFAILVRPNLILLILSYLPFYGLLRKRLVPLFLLALLPMVLWQVRVHRFAGRVDLHPIYHSDAADLYRPLHEAVWDFHKMTGQTGSKFHTSINLLWEAARGNVSEDYAASVAIRSMDYSVTHTFGAPELARAYYAYIDVLRQQVTYYEANLPITKKLSGEEELIAVFDSLREEYVAQNFVHAWVVAPLKVAGILVSHSNLSLYMFQKPLRGNVLMEVLRWISFFTHVFIFSLSLIFLFRKKSKSAWALVLPAAVFFFYLIFIQRGVEERYMLPFLVPLFLVGVRALSRWRFSGFHGLHKNPASSRGRISRDF